jgi:hypothetical protein
MTPTNGQGHTPSYFFEPARLGGPQGQEKER